MNITTVNDKIKVTWILLLISLSSFASTKITIGAYHFPPYFDLNNNGKPEGVVVDIIDYLNERQSKYEFDLYVTTAKRRYVDYKNNYYDIILFENLVWGWDNHNFTKPKQSKQISTGKEVFITHKKNKALLDKNDSIEYILKSSKIAFLGYHYKFSNYETNFETLKMKYNTTLTNDHTSIIRSVAEDRYQFGIITYGVLENFYKIYPELKDKIYITKYVDQEYDHRVLYNESKIDQKEMKNVLKLIKNFIKKEGL